MSNTIGQKIKQFRIKFDMSQKQATTLIGTGISHSSWAYWEKHGAPVERLVEIAKMTLDAKATYDWLTGTTGGQMPAIELMKPVPKGSGFSQRNVKGKKKTKKSGITRRAFTPQDRANLIAEIDRVHQEIGSFDQACRKVGNMAHSVVRRWMAMDLPAPNGDGVEGILPARTVEEPPLDLAVESVSLPQTPAPPPGKPGPRPGAAKRGGYHPPKVQKPKALITSQYLCPHCGSPVFLPEE